MCGIIGIASNKPVSINIINSLKKLEYRGYDSAGLATLNNNLIDENSIDELKLLLERFRSACLRDSLPGVAESDLSLHRHWVARASDNLEPIWIGLSVRILMKYSRLDSFEESIEEHEKIVDAIIKKDKVGAINALTENII